MMNVREGKSFTSTRINDHSLGWRLSRWRRRRRKKKKKLSRRERDSPRERDRESSSNSSRERKSENQGRWQILLFISWRRRQPCSAYLFLNRQVAHLATSRTRRRRRRRRALSRTCSTRELWRRWSKDNDKAPITSMINKSSDFSCSTHSFIRKQSNLEENEREREREESKVYQYSFRLEDCFWIDTPPKE